MALRTRMLEAAGRAGGLARRAGLGGLVERAGGLATRLAPREHTIDGLVLRAGHVGHLHYLRELGDGTREALLRRLLEQACTPGSTMLDAGAHIGFLTLVAARAVGPGGRVITFEPNPRTLPTLRANLERNGLSERVEIVELALGAEQGRAPFVLRGGGDESSLHGPDDGDVVEVGITSGDVWLAEHGVEPAALSAVKIDVEGAETDVVRGLEGTLAAAPEPLVLFAECNPEALAAAGSSPEELVGRLRALGFEVGWLDEPGGRVVPYAGVAWGGGYANLVSRRGSLPVA